MKSSERYTRDISTADLRTFEMNDGLRAAPNHANTDSLSDESSAVPPGVQPSPPIVGLRAAPICANTANLSDGSAAVRIDMRPSAPIAGLRAATTYANTDSLADGSAAVPTETALEILFGIPVMGGLHRRCKIVPSKTGRLHLPTDDTAPWGSTGIIASWDSEGDVALELKPVLGRAGFNLRKLRVFVPVSDELMEDAVALDAWLLPALSRATAWKLDHAIIHGSGAGRPLGLLNSDATITVAKDGGQAAATITDTNIAAMQARILDPNSAVWVASPTAFGQIAARAAYDPKTRLLGGAEIVWTDAAPALGSRGDLILADLANGYRIPTSGEKFSQSMHLLFDQDITAFKLTLRVDGAPSLSAPVTPPAGATRSHAVVLEARA